MAQLLELLDQLARLQANGPSPKGETYEGWAKRNYINNPDDPRHHYDNRAAFKAGYNRIPIVPWRKELGHFFDTFKLPIHPTFSEESTYAKPPLKWGIWGEGEKFIPFEEWTKPRKGR